MTRNAGPLVVIAVGAMACACDRQIDVGAAGRDGSGSPSGDATSTVPGSSDDTDGSATVTRPSDAAPSVADDGAAASDGTTFLQDGPACSAPPVGDAAGCWASCCNPIEAPPQIMSVYDLYAAVVGRWQFCTGIDNWRYIGAPADAIGVEFEAVPVPDASCDYGSVTCPRGNMYFLVQGPSGPVRGSGFSYEWTYDAYPEGPTWPQLFTHPTPNSGVSESSLLYSSCPTQLTFVQLSSDPPDDGGVLVPFY